jgi:hypothetical protein
MHRPMSCLPSRPKPWPLARTIHCSTPSLDPDHDHRYSPSHYKRDVRVVSNLTRRDHVCPDQPQASQEAAHTITENTIYQTELHPPCHTLLCNVLNPPPLLNNPHTHRPCLVSAECIKKPNGQPGEARTMPGMCFGHATLTADTDATQPTKITTLTIPRCGQPATTPPHPQPHQLARLR